VLLDLDRLDHTELVPLLISYGQGALLSLAASPPLATTLNWSRCSSLMGRVISG
jgi:hypothetical protein